MWMVLQVLLGTLVAIIACFGSIALIGCFFTFVIGV